MFSTLFLALGLVAQSGTPAPPLTTLGPAAAAAASSSDLESELLKVKRIYVDGFGDDKISNQLQAMVVNALNESKRFIVTENKDKADAVLKGNALEKTSQELHAIGEGTRVATAAGGEQGSFSGDAYGISGSHSGGFAARALGESDSQASTETINDARVAVRLVVPNGDVVWTSTQESTGAKYKGASADVADKVVKQLLRDLDRITKQQSQPATSPARTPDSSHAPA
jgi:hypothetical protein